MHFYSSQVNNYIGGLFLAVWRLFLIVFFRRPAGFSAPTLYLLRSNLEYVGKMDEEWPYVIVKNTAIFFRFEKTSISAIRDTSSTPAFLIDVSYIMYQNML